MADISGLVNAETADTHRSLSRVVDEFAIEALMAIGEFEAAHASEETAAHLKARFAAMWLGSQLHEIDPSPAASPAMRVLTAMAKLAADPNRTGLSVDAAVATIDKDAPGWDPSWKLSDVRTAFERRYGDFDKPPAGDWMKLAFAGLARANVALAAVESGVHLIDPKTISHDELVEYGRRAIDSDRKAEKLHERAAVADKRDNNSATVLGGLSVVAVATGISASQSPYSWAWALPAAAAVLAAVATPVARLTHRKLVAANKALGAGQHELRDGHDRLADRLVAEPVDSRNFDRLRGQHSARESWHADRMKR